MVRTIISFLCDLFIHSTDPFIIIVPSSPSIISAKEFDPTTVLLGIQPPDCPNGKILEYVVYYRNDLKIDEWVNYNYVINNNIFLSHYRSSI